MFFVKIPHSILNKKYFLIFLISLIIFVSKWYPLVLNQTNLTTEFFFNYSGDGKYWIPYIKFISEFIDYIFLDFKIIKLYNINLELSYK